MFKSKNPKFLHYPRVLIPGGMPEPLTYGSNLPTIQNGQAVLVPVKKGLKLGIILDSSTEAPQFEVRELQIHPSLFCFDHDFLENLKWISRYTITPLNQTLEVMIPGKFSDLLDKLNSEQNSIIKDIIPESLPELHPMQAEVIKDLEIGLHTDQFTGFLLHGVTGSGKTRVYLELIKKALAEGKKVLVLVPEIALTPQIRDVFERSLGQKITVVHSALGAKEKRQTWISILRKEVQLILGTRSAILAPFLNPDLIIVDEEHDGSYKQHDPNPRYHARDLAIVMAHRNNATLILGSATPSLESWNQCQEGHLKYLSMPKRVNPVELPKIKVVDMLEDRRLQGEHLLSSILREQLSLCLESGHQAIVLHNRRGYATSRICTQCGQSQECVECKIPLIVHRKKNVLLCHYCDRCYPLDLPCRECGSKELSFAGGAIEKVEEEIKNWIPQAKVLRMDRDTTSHKGSTEKMLSSFRKQEFNILLGTQMVAKGHDFPNVQLVGVISADIGSTLPDFRGNERSFQLLTQVAGRAGRSSGQGKVILQTFNPHDPTLRYALKQDYAAFAKWESQNRKDLHYPPYSKLLLIEISSRQENTAKQASERLTEILKKQSDDQRIRILGPSEAFVSFVRGHYRFQILMKGPGSVVLRKLWEKAIENFLQKKDPQLKIRCDMEPRFVL